MTTSPVPQRIPLFEHGVFRTQREMSLGKSRPKCKTRFSHCLYGGLTSFTPESQAGTVRQIEFARPPLEVA